MKKVILASNNKGKLAEIREILKGRFEVLSLSDCNIDVDVEETGSTFEENSFIKAKAIYELTKMPVIADDSGLTVNALNGAPGIYSARYAGEGHCDKDNNDKLLRELDGKEDRTASFVCCAVYFDGVKSVSATGYVNGRILFEPVGTGGFGYDPLFFCDEIGKCFGVATAEEKNKVSHRFRAFSSLSEKI